MPRTRLPTQSTAHDSALAQQIGARIREARKRSGLTQQQLAGERYTKAYVSALETGIARPSMVALSYLAERLSLPPSHFLDEQNPTWSRLAVDMTLASGDWQAAADGYASLLDIPLDDLGRGESCAVGQRRWHAWTGERTQLAPRRKRPASSARWDVSRTRRWPATGWRMGSTCRIRRRMRRASSRRSSSECGRA